MLPFARHSLFHKIRYHSQARLACKVAHISEQFVSLKLQLCCAPYDSAAITNQRYVIDARWVLAPIANRSVQTELNPFASGEKSWGSEGNAGFIGNLPESQHKTESLQRLQTSQLSCPVPQKKPDLEIGSRTGYVELSVV